MSAVAERKFQYQRLAPGLILLPANDGETILVVGKYQDGPTWGLDEPRDFIAWGWGIVPPGELTRMSAWSVEDAVFELRNYVYDNTWPRYRTMRSAIDAALTSIAAAHNGSRQTGGDHG